MITTVDEPVDPDDIVDQLAEAGLPARIVEEPTTPGRVGKVLGLSSSADLVIEGTDLDGDGRIEQLVVPAGFDGEVIVAYGVEDPVTSGLPPFDCERYMGRSIATVGDELDEVYPDAVWTIFNGPDDVRLDVPYAELPRQHVIVAALISPGPGGGLGIDVAPPDLAPFLVCDVD